MREDELRSRVLRAIRDNTHDNTITCSEQELVNIIVHDVQIQEEIDTPPRRARLSPIANAGPNEMNMFGVAMPMHPKECPSGEDIMRECIAMGAFLMTKNRKYGDSALNPIRFFSRADTEEQLRVRIDDKLSRLQSGQADEDEDVLTDLLGYMILERVARRRREEGRR